MYILVNVFLFYLLFNIGVEVQAIIDGSTASVGDLPFQVSVQFNDAHNCGGSILNQEFVITARHCVHGKPEEQLRVVAGAINLRTMEHASTHRVTNMFIRQPSVPNGDDLALLKVDPRIEFDDFRNEAALPANNSVLQKDQKVFIAGWGRKNASNSQASSNLKIADVYVLAPTNGTYVGEFHTLHKNLIKNKGVCKGDSGGPVALNKTVLVGVIAGSGHVDPNKPNEVVCGSKHYPDRHTKVSHYLNWIRGIVEEHSNYPLHYL